MPAPLSPPDSGAGMDIPGRVADKPVPMTGWLFLAVAIALEIVATSALKRADGFSNLVPTMLVLLGYGGAFYCLSVALRTIPLGVAYAIWSAVGIVAISIIGALVYRQTLDLAAMVGLALIVAGVLVINLLSASVRH
jgi:small multidrug resistance pump